MKSLIAAAFSLSLTVPASAESLRMLIGWPTGNPANTMGVNFQNLVNEAGNGEVSIELIGPDVVPPSQQLQPVSMGAFDLIFTAPAYHGGNKGLGMVMDAVAPDLAKRRSSGVMEFLDAYYQKEHNLKLLGVVSMGSAGYHCVLRQPLTSDGDWKGRKIRAAVTFHRVIEDLGGSPVDLPVAETYSALERGVIDGSCMPGGTVASFKVYEVAKYRVEPYLGTANLVFGINLNKWNALSEEARSILAEAAEKAEVANLEFGDSKLQGERDELAANGVTVQQVPEPLATTIRDAFDESIWKLGDTCCGSASEQLREIAKTAGLAE